MTKPKTPKVMPLLSKILYTLKSWTLGRAEAACILLDAATCDRYDRAYARCRGQRHVLITRHQVAVCLQVRLHCLEHLMDKPPPDVTQQNHRTQASGQEMQSGCCSRLQVSDCTFFLGFKISSGSPGKPSAVTRSPTAAPSGGCTNSTCRCCCAKALSC
jgi:hypothetical protein